MCIDTNVTILFDLIHRLAIQFHFRFNIDWFGYLSGTVHTNIKYISKYKHLNDRCYEHFMTDLFKHTFNTENTPLESTIF